MNFEINTELPQFLPHIQVPEINLPEWPDGESPYELMQTSAHNAERQRQILEEQIEPLKEIANSAKRQANSAEQQAESAKDIATASKTQADLAVTQSQNASKTSTSAKIRANASFIISVLALLATLLANADKIVHNIEKILSHLGML